MATRLDPQEKLDWENSFRDQFNRIMQEYKKTRGQIATAAKIDPSYTTLFSKTGRIPTRKVMTMVAKGLESLEVPTKDINALYLSAGYIPVVPKPEVIENLSRAFLSLGEGETTTENAVEDEDDVTFPLEEDIITELNLDELE
jgi:hypothetical protein